MSLFSPFSLFFFFNDTATTEIYTLSLHDALPIYLEHAVRRRQLIAAVQRLRVLPAAGRHHVHERHFLSLGGPLPSERMELTAFQMRQPRMPLDATEQLAEDLPRPVIVLVDAREQPPLANHCELHLETAQLLGQRLGNGNDAITTPLVELRPELDLGRIETDVRPTEAANRPNPRPSCFREHERHFPPLPALAPAFLRRRRRQVLSGLPELQKPVVRRDRSARVFFLRHLHAAKRVALEQPRPIRQPLVHCPVDHLAQQLDLALDRPGSHRSGLATIRPPVPRPTHRDVALHVVLGQVICPLFGTEARNQQPGVGLLLLARPFDVPVVARSLLLVSVPQTFERQQLGEADLLATLQLARSEEHTSELQSQSNLVCRLLLEKKKQTDCDS